MVPKRNPSSAAPKAAAFRLFSLIRALFQHIRILAGPIGTLIWVQWGIVRALHDLFYRTVDLLIGSFVDTPLKSLHVFGVIWAAGGPILILASALIGNFHFQLLYPLFALVIISAILVLSLWYPFSQQQIGWLFVQIPLWFAPLVFCCPDESVHTAAIVLGVIVAIIEAMAGLVIALMTNLMVGVTLLAVAGLLLLVAMLYWIASLLSTCGSCSDSTGEIDDPHLMFWELYSLAFAPFIYLLFSPGAALRGSWLFLLGLFLGIPMLVKLVECCYRCSPDRYADKVRRRRLFVAKTFGMGLFFILQQMNVPLAQFFLDAVFAAEIDWYFRVMLTFVMIGIQVVVVLVFNILMISEFSGDEKGYDTRLTSLDTAATSNFETYRYEYRYWLVLEVFYDILGSVWINIGSRGYPGIYCASVACHVLYTYLHAVLRPSLYRIHNCVNIATGLAQLVGDVAVLDSIYGNGSFSASGLWTLACGLAPPAVWLVVWLYMSKCGQPEGGPETEVDVGERCTIETRMQKIILSFLFLGTGGGVLFIHLVAVVGLERPPGYWWGLYVPVPLLTLALFLSPFIVWPEGRTACANCMNTVWCGLCCTAFCCRKVQISPSDPGDSENPQETVHHGSQGSL
jgi:hypothetical protein